LNLDTNKPTTSIDHHVLDEDLRDRASIDQAQPSRRIIRSMTQDPGLGEDPPLASASEPIIPQRITRSRAQAMGAEHQLVSLFLE